MGSKDVDDYIDLLGGTVPSQASWFFQPHSGFAVPASSLLPHDCMLHPFRYTVQVRSGAWSPVSGSCHPGRAVCCLHTRVEKSCVYLVPQIHRAYGFVFEFETAAKASEGMPGSRKAAGMGSATTPGGRLERSRHPEAAGGPMRSQPLVFRV